MPRTKKKKEVSWRNSRGKQMLLQDIRDGRIPDDMDWKDAFVQRPEFDVGDTWEEARRLFEGRIKTVRKLVNESSKRSTTELEMLRQDRAVCPPAAFNHRGEPRWDQSAAQTFLKQDVADKKHETMSRTAFYNSRPAYKLFQKSTISKHVDQEVRTLKFLKQYRARRNYY